MAGDNNDDIFQSIRQAVGQTLEMAEAESKISDETKTLLSQLILTRRGDGEVVLDVGALQRMKAAENQWVDKERSEQDRLVNPTRLPQLVPGLNGLASSQYLAFVQRPLERNGDNAPFLEAAAHRLIDEYNEKEKAAERNKLFGTMQRYVAKMLIDALLSKEHGITDQDELDKLRDATAPKDQFALASKILGIPTNEVMNRLYKLGVALTLIEGIKMKALKIRKAEAAFEASLRKLASNDSGPTAKTRIKEIFVGFKKELDLMAKAYTQITRELSPIIEKMQKDNFDQSFSNLHRSAAVLDAMASRWVIIIGEANNKAHRPGEIIKGMHKVFTH
ncbi:hypothetical protein RYZ26_00890 [Terasakiella sp. A23]|uniref:hypothetical protein n=1 Tax=Terasakiella sp. FCG-A23 TaxID=3080561 RepID=UPI002955C591|nr:hypothetical protein [Terasakiella sp. A23]MDV7338131.1 hypothetical protein [Terasakiella sp. A23]